MLVSLSTTASHVEQQHHSLCHEGNGPNGPEHSGQEAPIIRHTLQQGVQVAADEENKQGHTCSKRNRDVCRSVSVHVLVCELFVLRCA